jgi:peptide/nickel transport system substrate-binding protein
MVETLQAGLATVAHSALSPNQPEYQEIETRLPRYEYEPRKAAQLIEELGYQRGPDGKFRDAANQRLDVEILTSNQDVNQKTTAAVADFWQRIGVGVETEMYPPQRARDLEFHATRSGFLLLRHPMDVGGIRSRYRTADIPAPENRFVGGNLSRYSHPRLDALVDTYFVTVPIAERTRALGEIIYHIADQLPAMGLLYDANPLVASNRLVNWNYGRGSTAVWNVETWDVR